ncbi:metal ABC transporter solute-binding protein, Zn/Mn family [Pseudodesulfovibrio sediminis]|uniref:Cation ABC transporter substrate-binding protein n=1 Tax=Pseudodesulfovibrio sediminis TaxID=2810563 RepID=A0ABM7P9N1_9BACT|nr:zinc ABC transporter substrate-binding protein [Pseudodesulfovibrio sediminis]BCS89770.1 cation ABC transporter substrate-binding protein [Pseudodesulfovibrio sediminis]
MNTRIPLSRILIAACLLGTLLPLYPTFAHAGMQVFVSIMPQKYFVQKIGGEMVQVDVLVGPAANPHMYEPSPRQMAALSKSKAYFAIGINLEAVWLDRIRAANRELRVINTQDGIQKLPMAEHDHHDNKAMEHDHEDHEDNGILDPHIWLDPMRARTIAENTCKGLALIDPEHASVYEANLAALLDEINQLDSAIAKTLATLPEDRRSFMVFHPSWGYFAARYNLHQLPIEANGNTPSPRHLIEIIKHGREQGVHVVFVQPQFSQKSAQVIATELDAQVIPLDPLSDDWANNLRHAAEAFRQAASH